MTGDLQDRFDPSEQISKHPDASTIDEVMTFRLQRLVAIGERAGDDWSQRLFDLSLNEWRLLALVQARSPARAGDMADLLVMDKSQMSRLIKSLLAKGLIRSFPDQRDRRAVALEPTKAGVELYAKVFEEVMRSNERILDVLSEEEAQVFNRTLDKLIARSCDLLEARLGRRLTR